MGLLDNLLTKALDEEKTTQKGGKEAKSTKKVNSKKIAKELATKIAEIERREGALEEKENQLDKREQDLDKKLTEVEEIRKILGVDSLGYLSMEGLIESVGVPREKLCHACFTGDYPIAIQLEMDKLALETSTPADYRSPFGISR